MRFGLGALMLVVILAAGTTVTIANRYKRTSPLHDDAFIRSLVPYDIDAAWRKAWSLGDMPPLARISDDEHLSRREVFARLGLDERRMSRPWESSSFGQVSFLHWQVSPSYDLVCMTSACEPEWKDDDIFPAKHDDDVLNPERRVYGVRFVPRWWSETPK